MTHRWLLPALATVLLVPHLEAQATTTAEATMTPGKYVIEAHDTTKSFSPIAFELKGNGNFLLTVPDGTFSGKMTIKGNSMVYSDQGCTDDKGVQKEGSYTVHSERGGFWIEAKSDPCEGRGASISQWFFRPAKK